MENKTCSECLREKPLYEFPSNGGGRVKGKCKVCYNKAQAEYRDKNRERLQAQWREASNKYYSEHSPVLTRKLKRYGITGLEFDRLSEKQGGRCAVCGDRVELVIDHCHDSGLVRGLLCDSCNKGLGFLKDSCENLKAAVEYLTEPPAADILNGTG